MVKQFVQDNAQTWRARSVRTAESLVVQYLSQPFGSEYALRWEDSQPAAAPVASL